MATLSSAGTATLGTTIAALVAADGTSAAPHATSLRSPNASLRDLADAVHALCQLHGTPPSTLDLAIGSNGAGPLQQWLANAAAAFAGERAALVALTAAVGPLPSTPAQAESEAAVTAQRHALAMLARSDRAGCAVGAALAFVADWNAIRPVLLCAATRAGVVIAPSGLPTDAAVAQAAQSLAPSAATERAVTFGAQQLLAQHRGLWQLLDARASARQNT